MQTVIVKKHARSVRGSKAEAIKQLKARNVYKSLAERIVMIATAQHALRSYEWAQNSMANVTRKLRGSKFAPGCHDHVAFYFLKALWDQVIEDAKYQTGYTDQQWCKHQNGVLNFYGLRLPADTREISVKILKAARLLLIHQL